jgi:hypothetical protein
VLALLGLLLTSPAHDPNGNVLCTTTPCGPSFQPGTLSVVNPNFGHATAYQTPRSFRLLARFTF